MAARGGWLRAGVLGANDGLISTASLVMGVSAAALSDAAVMTAGLAGLVGGALSMAAGEYVSVSSQADSEAADLERERRELQAAPEAEHQELVGMLMQRGLSRPTAELVAGEYEQHDLLAVHARMELGITDMTRARPLVAALASMAAFTTGALVPLLLFLLLPLAQRATLMLVTSVVLLMALGALAARLGGAPLLRPALRVGAFGLLAMGATMLIGRLVGVNVP
ncbi:MAG: VIT1/CCC1 transporter family protein [Steroidobacteraceae bacterium]